MLNVRVVPKVTPLQDVRLPNGEVISPFVLVSVDDSGLQKEVKVVVNKNRIVGALANKDPIVGAINKHLCKMIQQYLERNAKAEEAMEL